MERRHKNRWGSTVGLYETWLWTFFASLQGIVYTEQSETVFLLRSRMLTITKAISLSIPSTGEMLWCRAREGASKP
eukprot:6642910-Pyramimonas_sp.AAC.3